MKTPSDETLFRSLSELKTAHNELLRRRRSEGVSIALLDQAALFIDEARASGVYFDNDEERAVAQSFLTFWANQLSRDGRVPSDPLLAEFDPEQTPSIPDELCPYVGLDAFNERDEHKFFGRRSLIAVMLERLAQQHLLAVVGPSGSGKSSLVRAGLIPALKRGVLPGSDLWYYCDPVVPGSQPLAALDRVLANLETGVRPAQTPPGAGIEAVPTAGAIVPIVIIVDQFEEIFTLCENVTERETFVLRLLDLASSALPHRVILTMRTDFETFIAQIPELHPLFEQSRLQVTPLGAGELREAIERPAAEVGLKFDAGLVDELVNDILGEPAALPLLQFTLLTLWERRRHNQVLLSTYQDVGGARQALARRADHWFGQLMPEDQNTARRILLNMVQPGDRLEMTSRRIRRTELFVRSEDSDRVERVLAKLIEARLVRLTKGDTPNDDQIEVAHEALIRNWPRLIGWIDQERTNLTTRRRYEARAAEWEQRGRRGGLLDDVELREVDRWMENDGSTIISDTSALSSLIRASKAAQDRKRVLIWSGIVSLVILFMFSIFLSLQNVSARTSAENAQSTSDALRGTAEVARQTAEASRIDTLISALATKLRVEPDRTVRLQMSVAAALFLNEEKQNNQFLRWQIEDMLRQSLQYAGLVIRLNANQRISVSPNPSVSNASGCDSDTCNLATDAAWSHDSSRVVLSTLNQSTVIWDIRVDHPVISLTKPLEQTQSVAWSPDDSKVALATLHGVMIFDSRNGGVIANYANEQAVSNVRWSPDGRMIAYTVKDIAYIIDALSGKIEHELTGHEGQINGIDWSPDGHYVLTASSTPVKSNQTDRISVIRYGTIWVWSEKGYIISKINTQKNAFVASKWSPSGNSILVATSDGKILIFDKETGNEMLNINDINAQDVSWNRDGKFIILANGFSNGYSFIQIRTTEDATIRSTLIESAPQSIVSWSPDGSRFVAVAYDGTASVYYANLEDLLVQAKNNIANDPNKADVEAYVSKESSLNVPSYINASATTNISTETPDTSTSVPLTSTIEPDSTNTTVSSTPLLTPSVSSSPIVFSAMIYEQPSDAAIRCGTSFSSKIWGVVRDSNGRGIKGAQVQISTADGKTRYKAPTNSQGGFQVPGLGCTTWIIRLVYVPNTGDLRANSISVSLNGGQYSGAGIEFRQQ